MRITIDVDDELLTRAQALAGVREESALLREALKALIARESAYQLARLGGTQHELKAPRRRRSQQGDC